MSGINPIEALIEESPLVNLALTPATPSRLPGIATPKSLPYQATDDEVENLIQRETSEPANELPKKISSADADALITNKPSSLVSNSFLLTSTPKKDSSSNTDKKVDPLTGDTATATSKELLPPSKTVPADTLPADSLTNPSSFSSTSANPIVPAIVPSNKNEEPSKPIPNNFTDTNVNFDLNAFKVEQTGKVSIEYKYDGGWYQGQLAIISLLGMDKFVPGSEAFTKEAARRALSNSPSGYIAISDNSEGAYYSNPAGENFNSGAYLGTKTFAMTPGDDFCFLLVPNGTVQQVYDNPAIGGDKRPLFSIFTSNPNDGFNIGQIADITGEGKLFVMEDMGVSQGSDRDYNDIIFKITGATSKIAPLSQFINSEQQSSHEELAQKLMGTGTKVEPKTDSVIDTKPKGSPKTDSIIDTKPSSEPKTDSLVDTKVSSEPKIDSLVDTKVSSEPKTDSLVDTKVSSEPKTDSLIDTKPSSEPKTDSVIETEPKETPKTDSVIATTPSSEPKNDSVIETEPKQSPKTDSVINTTPKETPKTDSVIETEPKQSPKNDSVIATTPSSEPKTDSVITESNKESSPKTEAIGANADKPKTESIISSDTPKLPKTELKSELETEKPQTASLADNSDSKKPPQTESLPSTISQSDSSKTQITAPTTVSSLTEKPKQKTEPTPESPTVVVVGTAETIIPSGEKIEPASDKPSEKPVIVPTINSDKEPSVVTAKPLTVSTNVNREIDTAKTKQTAGTPTIAETTEVPTTTAAGTEETPTTADNHHIKQPVATDFFVSKPAISEFSQTDTFETSTIEQPITETDSIITDTNPQQTIEAVPVIAESKDIAVTETVEIETPSNSLPPKPAEIETPSNLLLPPKSADTKSNPLLLATEEPTQIPKNQTDNQPIATQPAAKERSNPNLEINLSIAAVANSQTPGTFIVGETGEIKFDYLYDGGAYEGELGIFSLTGMEAFTLGTPEFIAEAFRRVLTNSTLGRTVISDSTEAAKFSGAMPGDGDWGSGEYQNVKTFNMTPGDTFAVMLIPNSSVQQAYDDLLLGATSSESRPLFSIAPANPSDTAYMLSLADTTGTGNTFALEDMSRPNSDSDYNDLIFKISGATGNAPNLDTLINPDREWRNTTLGQQLQAEANPPNSDNNPPVVSPTSVRTYTELETTISLGNLAADAEGDPLTISVLNPVNGTVIFNPSTNKASFKPAPGFSGIASFDLLASDPFGSSTPARVSINVSDVPLLNLDFVKRNPRLNAGENTELVVLGDFADQKGVVLPDSYLTYTSINPEIAPIDPTGKVTGLTNGTSILSASRNNLQAVTPIRIGTMPAPTTDAQLHQILAEMYGLDPYPDAVSLTPGATRKLSLSLNSNFTQANLTAASTGTRYFSNNSNILNVSPDGTITAVGIGDASVTAIHGTASATIPVRVEAPKIGTTALGTDGGIVNSSDGTLVVMIPPGALKQNATVSIAPVNQQNLSLPLPPGFEFAGAFNLNFSDNSLNIPAQLAIPAPAGLAPGTVAYFLRKGAIPDSTGTWNPIWLQEESGIVGEDGNIRTQSPPYPGVVRPGEYAVVYSSPTGSATLVKGQLTLNYNFPLAFFGIIDPLGNIGQLIDPDKFVTTPAFTVTRDISSVQVVAIPKVGLPVVTEVGVQRNDDGTATFKAALNMPAPTTSDPTTPPVLQKAELKFKDDAGQPFENNEPLLFLTGGNILVNNASDSKGSRFTDLTVKFSVGNSVYEGAVVPTRSRSLGGNQYEVAVKVPDTVVLGASGVVLERKQNQIVEQNGIAPVYKPIEYNSNPIRLPQGAEYVFATQNFPPTNPKNLSELVVIKGSNPKAVVEATRSKDLLISRIPVGDKSTDAAEASAVTSDGTRVYVVLRESGRVAMVDPMVLRQVDTQPNTPGVNPIVLPAGAKPKSIVISPRDEYAYMADRDRGDIYVLDIDPFSATYHQVIQTINVGSNTTKLRNLAISSDGRKLFATASDNYIYAVNIDPKDRPNAPNSNPRKWHEKIGAVAGALEPTGLPLGVTGLSATPDPLKMVFTSGNTGTDGKGYGVLEITNDDPLNLTATNRYINLSLGSANDYFDVNEGVSVTVMRDGRYAFVAGRNNRDNVALFPDPLSGSNIGIIKDPLGPNPQLVAATRPIPGGLTNDLVLSNDNKSLFSSYPAPSSAGSVYAFDVEEMIKTLDNPGQFKIDSLDRGVKSPFFNATTAKSVTVADFTRVPIDDINPAISIAADYGILQENRPANQFTYGVLPGTTRAPVATGGNLRDLSIAPTDWLDLTGPGAITNDLTPTLNWQFAPGWENVKEVNLFVSTFDKGKGLLPWDKVVDLSDSTLLPGLSETQKRELLSKPWNGYDDFNPNRILTATWKKDTGKWYGYDGITPLDQPLNDPANTSTNFTLPRSLTAGQNYNFAVESVSNSGAVIKDFGQFKTLPPVSNSPFSSVSVLTHGFTLLPNQSGIPDSFFQMANKIATVSGNTPENSGLIMRYDKPTGNWIPIDLQGRVITDLTEGLKTSESNYLSTLANNLKKGVAIDGKEIKYLNQNKPLVLLPEWSLDRESVIPDVGFSEGAADALFASLVQLDLALGGKVGEYQNNQLQRLYDSQGNLIRQQGDLFNSPLHFMGFSRGTVVNSEIVQRLGTFFPQAGGKSMADRDLQMTTIDPHDFYQPSLELKLPNFISTNFSDFYEPKVQVWNNVTFADNYYQTVADPNSLTATPNGRSLGLLPQEELNKNPKPAGLNFPKASGVTLGKADREILLGTRNGEPDRENSRIGFTKDDVIAGTHKRAFGWYAGTVDLDLEEVLLQYPHVEASEKPQAVNDMLGKMGLPELFDPNFPAAKPWYDNGNGEGVGEGWFYSVLGGGKDQRTFSSVGRVPVSFDNTLEAGMRGDYAVPTLFNGNFDQFIPNKSAPEEFGRNTISKEIPGWSFHNNSPQVAQASTSNSPNTENLVDWSQIDTLKDYIPNQRNYALKLEAGSSITHNRFVVPDWGSLRLDLHAPGVTNNFTVKPKGTLDVTIRPLDSSIPAFSQTITLQKAQNGTDGGAPSTYLEDKYKVDYGRTGFESFYIDVPERLRGQAATVDFKDSASIPVYLDNVFFQSDSLKFGNPNRARTDLNNTYQTNYLIEKPQYTLSYNGLTNTPNWVGWILDKGWVEGNAGRAADKFAEDPELPAPNFYRVQDNDYDFKSQISYTKDEYGRFLWNKKAFFWADRGHLTPSADRQRSKKDNIATFLTTNIIPQDSKQNSGIWATQEAELRKLAKNRDFKFFLFAGGSGEGGGTVTYGPLPTEVKGPKPIQIGDSNPNQFANFTAGTDSDNQAMIQVPDALWKVVLGFSPENKSEIPDIHFAWWIPNNSYSIKETLDYTKPTQYSDGLIGPTFENRAWNDGAFTMSIKALEARLNKDLPLDSQYDFLSNIHDPAVKDNLRSVQRLLPQ